jgi:hypothetical protein
VTGVVVNEKKRARYKLKYCKPLKKATLSLRHCKCIRCSHFKVDDVMVSALEASSKPPVPIFEDNVTALATYAMALVPAWMP